MVAPTNQKLFDLQNNFKQYYDANLRPKFVQLETKRLNYNHTFWARLLTWIILDIALLYDLINHCKIAFIPTLIIALIVSHFVNTRFKQKYSNLEFICGIIIILSYLAFIPKDIFNVPEWQSKIICGITSIYLALHSHILMPVYNYKSDTKQNLQQEIIDFFGDFKYTYKRTLPLDILKSSQLFSGFHTQNGDDYFFGTYQGVAITVSEEELITGSGKNKHAVFRGIMVKLAMNKNFNGQTVVRQNSFYDFSVLPRDFSKVTLEDIKFNDIFKVSATNQVEARYILTTVFMENIIKLKEMYHGKKIELSFFDNNVLIAITTAKDMFETTSLFRSTLNYEMMGDVVKQFFYIFEIIEVLQLNKKILQ